MSSEDDRAEFAAIIEADERWQEREIRRQARIRTRICLLPRDTTTVAGFEFQLTERISGEQYLTLASLYRSYTDIHAAARLAERGTEAYFVARHRFDAFLSAIGDILLGTAVNETARRYDRADYRRIVRSAMHLSMGGRLIASETP